MPCSWNFPSHPVVDFYSGKSGHGNHQTHPPMDEIERGTHVQTWFSWSHLRLKVWDMGYACYFQRKYHEGLSASLGKIRGNVAVFTKHGYSVSVVQAGHHHTQQIDWKSALQMVEKGIIDYIPFTQTFHPYNHAVKSIIFKNFKLIQNDSD